MSLIISMTRLSSLGHWSFVWNRVSPVCRYIDRIFALVFERVVFYNRNTRHSIKIWNAPFGITIAIAISFIYQSLWLTKMADLLSVSWFLIKSVSIPPCFFFTRSVTDQAAGAKYARSLLTFSTTQWNSHLYSQTQLCCAQDDNIAQQFNPFPAAQPLYLVFLVGFSTCSMLSYLEISLVLCEF